MKKCIVYKIEKDESNFHKKQSKCKECQKEHDRLFQKSWARSNLRPYSAKQNVLDGNRKAA